MLKIRLARLGKKHQPFYRVVVTEARSKRDGKVTDLVGYYDPKTQPPTVKLDREKLQLWQTRGAQLTPAVTQLLESKPTKQAKKAKKD
jgi:small subunit ribosomal protein S16